MNKVILSGRIASDIEMRTTQSGTSAASFRIAVQRRFRNANGVYEADFINCVAWRNTADFIAKYFAKGNGIEIEGSIQTRSYTAQDGSNRYVTEVLVDNCEFPKGESGKGKSDAGADQGGFTEVDESELPF